MENKIRWFVFINTVTVGRYLNIEIDGEDVFQRNDKTETKVNYYTNEKLREFIDNLPTEITPEVLQNFYKKTGLLISYNLSDPVCDYDCDMFGSYRGSNKLWLPSTGEYRLGNKSAVCKDTVFDIVISFSKDSILDVLRAFLPEDIFEDYRIIYESKMEEYKAVDYNTKFPDMKLYESYRPSGNNKIAMTKKEAYNMIKCHLDSLWLQPVRRIKKEVSCKIMEIDDSHEIHYIYEPGQKGISLQLNIQFEETWADSLVFVSPTLPIDERSKDLPLLLCQINCYIKANCRIYLDENRDIAISSRIKYDFLEVLPEKTFRYTVEASLNFYYNVITPIYDYITGSICFDEASDYISELWAE